MYSNWFSILLQVFAVSWVVRLVVATARLLVVRRGK